MDIFCTVAVPRIRRPSYNWIHLLDRGLLTGSERANCPKRNTVPLLCPGGPTSAETLSLAAVADSEARVPRR